MTLIFIIPFLASLGFLLAVITFIAGFRMVRRPEQQVELLMHRVDGIITIALYILLAVVSLVAYGMHMTSLLLWALRFWAPYVQALPGKKEACYTVRRIYGRHPHYHLAYHHLQSPSLLTLPHK